MDTVINLLFEPWFWFGILIVSGFGLLLISLLDRRDWKNYNKNYEDFHDDSV